MSDTATTVLGENLTDDKPAQEAQTPTEAFLSKYVGEGKKYKSEEDLAKAYANAEQFIETLKSEKQTLQQEMESKLSQAKTVEDIMAALTAQPETTTVTKGDDRQPTISPEQIEKLVESHLTKKQQLDVIKANQDKAWTALAEAFGDKEAAKKAVAEYIGGDKHKQELVNQMGSYTPNDLVKLIAPAKQAPVSFSEPGEVVPDTVMPAGELSWDQVKQIKKQNPVLFKSREFQKKLHKLAAEGKLN